MLGQSVLINGLTYRSHVKYNSDSSDQGRFWRDQEGFTSSDRSATVEIEARPGLIILNLQYQYTSGDRSTRRFAFKGQSIIGASGEVIAFVLEQKTEWVRYLQASDGYESENITVENFSPGSPQSVLTGMAPTEESNRFFYYDSVDGQGGMNSKSEFFSLDSSAFFEDNWWLNPFGSKVLEPQSNQISGSKGKADVITFNLTPSFGTDAADRITNFSPKEKDRLVIEKSCFGGSLNGTFRIAKNNKTLGKVLNSSTEFVYLRSSGEILFNENGSMPGYGDGGVFALLDGRPALKISNVGFV
jgi:hypothetical protein